MEEKIVSTQKKLDDLVNSNFKGLIIIKETKEEINIFKNGKSLIDVSGSAQIGYVSGNGLLNIYSSLPNSKKSPIST